MTEITAPPIAARRASRRGLSRRSMIIGGLAALVATGGGAAIANSPAVSRNGNGMVGIEVGQLRTVYQGRYVTPTELSDLEKAGRVVATVNSVELACQGISLAVSTEAERVAYGDGYKARSKALGRQDPTAEPCAAWATSPRFAPVTP